MRRTLTSNVAIDRQIAEVMIPPVPVPFKDLLTQAQTVLDQLAQSRFLPLYIKEKTAAQQLGFTFLRLAHNPDNDHPEWLILTKDCRLKFLQKAPGDSAMRLYEFDETTHNELLLQRASCRLAEMQDVPHALHFLFGRFGKPSFSVADISAEIRHNGRVKVVLFTERYPRLGISDTNLILRTITARLELLQFGVASLVCDFNEVSGDPLTACDTSADEEVLFVINCSPQSAAKVKDLYSRFSPEAKKRLLISLHPNCEKFGLPSELTKHLPYDKACKLPDDELLTLLDNMFDN